jgi:hypothetical protein
VTAIEASRSSATPSAQYSEHQLVVDDDQVGGLPNGKVGISGRHRDEHPFVAAVTLPVGNDLACLVGEHGLVRADAVESTRPSRQRGHDRVRQPSRDSHQAAAVSPSPEGYERRNPQGRCLTDQPHRPERADDGEPGIAHSDVCQLGDAEADRSIVRWPGDVPSSPPATVTLTDAAMRRKVPDPKSNRHRNRSFRPRSRAGKGRMGRRKGVKQRSFAVIYGHSRSLENHR